MLPGIEKNMCFSCKLHDHCFFLDDHFIGLCFRNAVVIRNNFEHFILENIHSFRFDAGFIEIFIGTKGRGNVFFEIVQGLQKVA